MNNDLISRSELKIDLEQYFSDGTLESVSAKLAFFMIKRKIDDAPTVETSQLTQDLINKVNVNVGLAQPIEDERPQGEPVIKCQDCKYRVKEWREDRRMKEKGYWVYGCKHFGEIIGFWGFGGNDNEFCSDAERKGGAE